MKPNMSLMIHFCNVPDIGISAPVDPVDGIISLRIGDLTAFLTREQARRVCDRLAQHGQLAVAASENEKTEEK
jgi:hypothetical protein